MESKIWLVALVGSSDRRLEDAAGNPRHMGKVTYEYVLVSTFTKPQPPGQIISILQRMQKIANHRDGHVEVHSHATLSDTSWKRFKAQPMGVPAGVHGTGLDAVIHYHDKLEQAQAQAASACLTFVARRYGTRTDTAVPGVQHKATGQGHER